MAEEVISISIRGAIGSGKTLLLISLLEAMADNGFLTAADTKRITENPGWFLRQVRPEPDNRDGEEIATVTICKASLLTHHGITLKA